MARRMTSATGAELGVRPESGGSGSADGSRLTVRSPEWLPLGERCAENERDADPIIATLSPATAVVRAATPVS